MKPLPRPCIYRMLVLITASGALTHCSSDKTYLSKPVNMSDLRNINPRGYLNSLTPHEREAAAMEMGSREMESRKIERSKFIR